MILDDLCSEEFQTEVGIYATPAALRKQVEQSPTYVRMLSEVRVGNVTDEDLERFTNRLLSDHRKGVHFIHERALSAIAVLHAATGLPGSLPFLVWLSSLESSEFALCYRVARLLLESGASVDSFHTIQGSTISATEWTRSSRAPRVVAADFPVDLVVKCPVPVWEKRATNVSA